MHGAASSLGHYVQVNIKTERRDHAVGLAKPDNPAKADKRSEIVRDEVRRRSRPATPLDPISARNPQLTLVTGSAALPGCLGLSARRSRRRRMRQVDRHQDDRAVDL